MVLAITVLFLVAIIVAVVYAFLIMPRVTDRADMDMLSTDYAHRGLHSAGIPENSLPAFAMAINNGYGIEFDVQLSADGEVIVFHDDTLSRMCGKNARVRELTLAQIRSLHLLGTPYTVPTLSEVLELVDGRVPLLIEIKRERAAEQLCQSVAKMLDTYPGSFAIQSFDPFVLAYFKRYRPRFARGQLVCKIKRAPIKRFSRLGGFLLSHMLLNLISRPDFISISGARVRSVSFRLCISLFKCKGFVWTVTKKEQYRRIRSLGLFAIFEKFQPK